MLFMRTSDGLDLQFREIGRGPTVLFSHEFGGSHASWEKQIERLATTHRCIAYTARGFSPSTASDSEMRYGRHILVQDLVELTRHLKLERFHLVGAGMGAATSLFAAELLGDKVKTITLAGCPAGPLSQLELYEHRSRIRKVLLALEQKKPALASWTLWNDRPDERLIGEKAAWWQSYRRIFERHDTAGLVLTLKRVEWDTPDFKHLERRLRRIEAPTLLVLGDEDRPAAHRTNEHLARTLPFARLVRLPHCGPLAHIEQPAVFNKLLWQHVRDLELSENGQRHYSKLELSLNLESS